jgi:hypothetical protein
LEGGEGEVEGIIGRKLRERMNFKKNLIGGLNLKEERIGV